MIPVGKLESIVRRYAELDQLLCDPKVFGDPQKLKAANAALDEATKPLADLLMDRAIDAALKKKGLV